MPPRTEDHTGLLLELLLRESRSTPLGGWDDLLALAGDNTVLLRAAGRLERLHPDLAARVAASVERERARVERLWAAIRTVAERCADRGIPYLFPKALRHFPDMGWDVDLLVLARPPELAGLLASLHAERRPGGLSGWISATARYALPGCPAPLDVQYGRLGLVGEHAGYAAQLVRRAQRAVIGGTEVCIATIEDQLVLEGIQRVFGRRSLRLGDVVWAASALSREALDCDYVVRTASRVGCTDGLGCFLSFADQAHRRLGAPLPVPAVLRQHLPFEGWGPVRFRNRRYRFRTVRVNARLSLRALEAKIARHDWAGAARLSLVPLLPLATALERVSPWRGR